MEDQNLQGKVNKQKSNTQLTKKINDFRILFTINLRYEIRHDLVSNLIVFRPKTPWNDIRTIHLTPCGPQIGKWNTYF